MIVEVPHGRLDQETLARVIEEFVTRQGTDYGAEPVPLARQVAQVLAQLESGQARLVYDTVTLQTHVQSADPQATTSLGRRGA